MAFLYGVDRLRTIMKLIKWLRNLRADAWLADPEEDLDAREFFFF